MKLQEKYGCEFTATHIGDRWGKTTATLYVTPKENTELVFTAIIDAGTRNVIDDYAERSVNYLVERGVYSAMETDCFVRSLSVSRNPIEENDALLTAKEFLTKHALDHYTVYLVLEKENALAENILAGMQKAAKTLEVKLLVIGYVLEGGAYQTCADAQRGLPGIGATAIEKYEPIYLFDFMVDESGSSVTVDELKETLGGN